MASEIQGAVEIRVHGTVQRLLGPYYSIRTAEDAASKINFSRHHTDHPDGAIATAVPYDSSRGGEYISPDIPSDPAKLWERISTAGIHADEPWPDTYTMLCCKIGADEAARVWAAACQYGGLLEGTAEDEEDERQECAHCAQSAQFAELNTRRMLCAMCVVAENPPPVPCESRAPGCRGTIGFIYASPLCVLGGCHCGD